MNIIHGISFLTYPSLVYVFQYQSIIFCSKVSTFDLISRKMKLECIISIVYLIKSSRKYFLVENMTKWEYHVTKK